ncbi:FOG: Transposase-like protein [Parafrankia sp. EAN1pec]|uniref:IS701 family transposase n=1 Tax=Parafrankia sp. (strain EAN1pec) TaxID=298653 RepID=UPI0000543699|nr:FOG: Transposase-like protein [Frankia sp. EAN1pec]
MATPRKPTAPTAEAIDRFCGHFDDLFGRLAERTALRQYLIGLLLPRERNKTLTELAAVVPGADRQRLHHFLHDAPWDPDALGARRVDLWRRHPELGPHGNGVLIIDETGDRKRGHGIVLAAQQYIGKLGRTANGVVAVTSHWADGSRHVPLGVRPYRPASRLPAGKADPAFATKPELAWELIEEARGAGVPFRAVVADCVYGENPTLEGRLRAARIRYVLALRPRHGTWQFVADPAHPPAFTPAEAAARLPLADWRRLVLTDSHGRPLVRHVAELELGPCYGPTRGTRLIAATADPTVLTADSTWFMATNLSTAEADAGRGLPDLPATGLDRALLQAGQARAGLGGLPGPFRTGYRAALAAGHAGVHLQPAERAALRPRTGNTPRGPRGGGGKIHGAASSGRTHCDRSAAG